MERFFSDFGFVRIFIAMVIMLILGCIVVPMITACSNRTEVNSNGMTIGSIPFEVMYSSKINHQVYATVSSGGGTAGAVPLYYHNYVLYYTEESGYYYYDNNDLKQTLTNDEVFQ